MDNQPQNQSNRPSLAGAGCLVVALAVGFFLGFNAGGQLLPPGLNWLFGIMFAMFFGVLAFIFTGIGGRRERGVVSETFLAIPFSTVVSLRKAVENSNPVTQLDTARVAALDAVLAELDELAILLKRQPRAGTNPALKTRLEEIATSWLDEERQRAWLEAVEPQN